MTKVNPEQLYPHLHPSALVMIDLPAEDRAAYSADFKSFWVESAQIKAVLTELNWRVSLPPSKRTPHLLLLSDPGGGKTTLLTGHSNKLLGLQQPDSSTVTKIHTIFDLTAIKDVNDLVSLISETIGCPIPRKTPAASALRLLAQFGNRSGARLWTFDELQQLIQLNPKDRSAIIAGIKRIANDIVFALCGAGSSDAASVFADERHMRARFRQMRLEPWLPNPEFHSFWYGVVSRLPLKKPSKIFDEKTLAEATGRSRGNTETIIIATRRSAQEGILDGSEEIKRDRLLALMQM